MEVKGLTGVGAAGAYTSYTPVQTAPETTPAGTDSEPAAVYEKSSDKTADKEAQRSAIISQLKADAETRLAQMEALVKQLMSGQGNAYGQATDMWQFLASGNFTVDAATKSQAQHDISEDGYWGVKQTSDRILDFAIALSGGDTKQMEKMRAAFEKGYGEATKAWGQELPDISRQTYDAVQEKFDKWFSENTQQTT